MVAAIEAVGAGASVLVAESEDRLGGSSRLSGAMLMGSGTRLQAANAIEDSPDELYRYYMTLNQWRPEPALVRRFADEAGPAIDWLMDLGVEFHPSLVTSGDEPVPRNHMPVGEGEAVMAVLTERARDAGVEFALRRRVDRLLTAGGRVTGVAVGDDELQAGAVVIATGGFGADYDLVRAHVPEAAAAGDWLWYVGAPGARGDALRLGTGVNAQIAGDGRALLLLTPNFGNVLEGGYFPGWLVMVNGQGRRFFDEMTPYSTTQGIVTGQPRPIFAVFDDAAKRQASPTMAEAAKRINIPHRATRAQKWVAPMLDEMIERGVVLAADSLEDLGGKMRVPIGNFVGTIDGYNRDVSLGRDSLYLKQPRTLMPVATPPFYATELRLAHLPVTGMGLRIDRDSRVLDGASRPIPGLFAAGECTGGLLGDVYVGSGNSFTGCITFGRIAGRIAAVDPVGAAAAAE